MRGEPFTLTSPELELDVQPLTRTPVAMSAVAWVRYGGIAIKIAVEVVAWTARAVAVWRKTPTGEIHRAWVWTSAVEHGPAELHPCPQQRRSAIVLQIG